MISWCPMYEQWDDTEDDSFVVDMTPEGEGDDLEMTFSSQEEFWKWYYGE